MEQKTLTHDSELAAEIQRGQSSAEATLYEKYSARVYYLALSELRSREDAEDVRIETFMRVIRAIRNGQLRSAESLCSFIVGTAHNVIREGFKQRRKVDQISRLQMDSTGAGAPDPFFLDPHVKRAIEQVINRLKPRERAFLRMYYYEELPQDEIARNLGLKRERLRLIKSRALKNFRDTYLRLVKT
jgi:RNA polymerase sigma-70 factor (ECF subfamily)